MQEYLNELKNKYGYDDNLLKAIEIVINLMIEEYGVQEQSEIFSLFAGVQIISSKSVTFDDLRKIDRKKESLNPHIKFIEQDDVYKKDAVSSFYSYVPRFSGDMKVMEEIRYIVVPDMVDANLKDGYYGLFNTTINIPFFLHEANHYYAMSHPEYIYDGKKILAKHGMFTEAYEYKEDTDGKYIVEEKQGNDIILEDILCENITRRMLCKYFKKDNYKDVKKILKSINHGDMMYNPLLLTIGEKIESIIGSKELMNYRKNNDSSSIIKFNEIVNQSEIALEYLDGKSPFDYLCDKVYELYTLVVNRAHGSVENYAEEASRLMLEAFAPLFAYDEVKYKTMNLEEYNKKRDKILEEYSKKNSNGLAS